MNAAFYIRSATGNERQIAEQKVNLEIFASRNGIHGWTIYEDHGSGVQELPAFTQLIKDAQNGKIDLIVTSNLHRITRDYSKLIDFLELMPELNVRFIAIEDDIDSEKGNPIPSQDFMAAKKLFTEQYIKELSHKVRERMASR